MYKKAELHQRNRFLICSVFFVSNVNLFLRLLEQSAERK